MHKAKWAPSLREGTCEQCCNGRAKWHSCGANRFCRLGAGFVGQLHQTTKSWANHSAAKSAGSWYAYQLVKVDCRLTSSGESTEPTPKNPDTTVELLFRTYPYYTDRTSRKAVQECLQADCLYPPYTSRLLELYKNETEKLGIAPANAFVLVEWGSILLQHAALKGTQYFQEHGLQLVQSHARALELVLASSLHAKKGVHRSAIVITRRVIRKVLRLLRQSALSLIVEKLTAKGQPLGIKSASFLGVLAGVCSRLTEDIAPLEKHKQEYYAFYLHEVLGARSLVPTHLASALSDFFSDYTTFEDVRTILVPTLEKALLRAPETILNDLVSPLFGSISKSIDVAPILANNLSKPLLSNLKSSNPSIRDGASSAFSILLSRSSDTEALGKVVDDILLPMATPKLNTDHRALHARILAMVPAIPAKAKDMSELLCTILLKETNEVAVGSEISALLCQFQQLSQHQVAVAKTVTGICIKGLEDKRPGIRRQWMLGVGLVLWDSSEKGPRVSFENTQLGKLAAECLPCFIKVTEEVIQNPITAVSSGLAVAPMITSSLCRNFLLFGTESMKVTIRKAKVMDNILSINPRTATLLNPRVYTKLSDPDFPWQIRALLASSAELKDRVESDFASAWSQAIIHLIATNDQPEVREMATSGLTKVYLENRSVVAKIMINGLWTWYKNAEADRKDTAVTASYAGMRRLQFVIRSICHPYDQKMHHVEEPTKVAMQAQLIDMLVLCRPEILPHVHWIEVCLRVGEDPGLIAKSYAESCLQRVERCLNDNDGTPAVQRIRLAAYNTAAELAFVSPDAIIPLLLALIIRDLPVDEVSKCGATKAAIARTSENIPFIDVLSSQNQRQVLDKNSRDYDTVKWEAEMRDQIAKKKGQERKLTTDEKAKVNAQLVKEASIRQQVRKLEQKLTNGIGYIHALAVGPPTEAVRWISPCLQALTAVIEAGVARLVGDAADEVYLACSSFVSLRLGSLRRFIGVATLRMLGSHLSPHLEQEPLKGLQPNP